MTNYFLLFVLALCSCLPALAIRKVFSRRVQKLEQDLQSIITAVSQMADIQAKSHCKLTASYEGLEERIMELCVPSHNAQRPLDRRHQVLTLARRGMEAKDIARRLKAPVGETELILNLGKFAGTDSNMVPNSRQEKQYA